MLEEVDDDILLFAKAIIISYIGFFVFVLLTGVLFFDAMVSFSGNLIYPITASIISFLLTLSLIYRTELDNILQIRFLIFLFVGVSLFSFFQIFDWLIAISATPFKRPIGYPLLNIADLFIVIVPIALYYHFESIQSGDPNFIMILLISIFTSPFFVLSFLVIVFENEDANRLLFELLPYFAITVVIITIYGMNTMFQIFFKTQNRQNKVNALVVIFGLFFQVFSFASQALSSDEINFGFFTAEVFQLAIFSLSLLIIGYVYVRHPSFLYVTTSIIHQVILLKDDEVKWIYQKWPKKFDLEDFETIGKVLSTSSSLLEELTGNLGIVQSVHYSNRGTIERIKLGEYSVLLLIEENSRYMKSAIIRFGKRIEENVLDGEIDIAEFEHQFYKTFQIS